MRSNKVLFIIIGILSVILLVFLSRFQQCIFIYDISLACFGSALIGCLIALITYGCEKRSAMEHFWQSALIAIRSIEKIEYLSCDAPIELVKNALFEEWMNESYRRSGLDRIMIEQNHNKDALFSWLREFRIDQAQKDACSTETIEKCISELYKKTLSDARKLLNEVLISYIRVVEMPIEDLDNAYGGLDFLFGNLRIRNRLAYNNIYLPIKKFRKKCAEETYHFKLYLNGEGNVGVCIDKVINLERQVFLIKGGCIYNNLSDLLRFNLERFRMRIYHCKPENHQSFPIATLSSVLNEFETENDIHTDRIPFLNTYVDNLTIWEAKDCVDRLINKKGYHYVVTPNTDNIVRMQSDYELKTISENADLILTDGQVVVNISSKTKHPIGERVAMTDFVWHVFDLAAEKDYGIFLLGGKESVLEKATSEIKSRYSSIRIVDTYAPPMGFEDDMKQTEYIDERIKASKPDILIVFLGCPKQEKFIANNKDKYQVPISFTMGGCVDFIAGSVKRAPIWMQRAGLEWLFRFVQEPKRLFKRYFIDDMEIFELSRVYKKLGKGDRT